MEIFIYDRLQPIQVEVTVKNIMENGITTEMLMTVCNELKVKINLFTHDDTGQVKRETNSGEISHQGGKTLNLIVENNHTYVLTDINQVRRFNGKNTKKPLLLPHEKKERVVRNQPTIY